MELEEKRLNNRSKEGLLEREIAERMTKIQALRQSIQSKEEEFSDPGPGPGLAGLSSSSSSFSFSPSAPASQYESLYSCLTSSVSQASTASPSPPSQDWQSCRSVLAKSMESLTPAAPVVAEDSSEKMKYSR